MRRFLIPLLVVMAWPAWADMYPDASNAKLPDARAGLGVPAHVATNAALIAASTAAFPSGVWRDDYAAGLGAPPQWYLPGGSVCSLGGNGDNGSQVKSADGKCWLAVVPAMGLDAREFGADASGVADSTTPLQNWGNWAAAAPGRTGFLAAGTYAILSPLVWGGASTGSLASGWTLRGTGMGSSKILYKGAATNVDIVTVQHASNILLDGWQVNSATAMTAKAGVHISNVNYSSFHDFSAGDVVAALTLYNGIFFDNITMAWLNLSRPYARNDGIQVANGAELNLDSVWLSVDGNSGVHLGGNFGGLYFGHVSVLCTANGQHGVIIDTALNALGNLQVFFSDSSVFDTCQQDIIYVNDSASTTAGLGPGIKSLVFNGWAAAGQTAPTANGMHVAAWAQGLLKFGGSAVLRANQGSGLKVDDVSTFVSIDPAATFNGNAKYGVDCTNPMTIQSGGNWKQSNGVATWINGLASYTSNCHSFTSFTPVATCGTAGTPPTLTGNASNYDVYGLQLHVHFQSNFGSTGTCTGSLKLSMPTAFTVIGGCTFHGLSLGSGSALTGFAEGSPNDVKIAKYDGTILQSSGDGFLFDGICDTTN